MSAHITRRSFGWMAIMSAMGVRLGNACAPAAAGSRSQLDSWRSVFPILDQPVGGRPLVYLDSAATTQRPTPVLEAIMDFYRHDNANPGATLHELARRAHEKYENAR